MTKQISETRWSAIRRDWLTGDLTIAEMIRKHGVSRSAINRRAKRNNWQRGAAQRDPLLGAQLLYDDLSVELQQGLKRLRGRGRNREAPEKAAERAQLIRAHRRALLALVEARKSLPDPHPPRADQGDAQPTIDLDAARGEVQARLARLADQAACAATATSPVQA